MSEEKKKTHALLSASNTDTDIGMEAYADYDQAHQAMQRHVQDCIRNSRCESEMDEYGASVWDGKDLSYWQIKQMPEELHACGDGKKTDYVVIVMDVPGSGSLSELYTRAAMCTSEDDAKKTLRNMWEDDMETEKKESAVSVNEADSFIDSSGMAGVLCYEEGRTLYYHVVCLNDHAGSRTSDRPEHGYARMSGRS